MSATTVAAPVHAGRAQATARRIVLLALLALAVVVLLAGSFAIGRSTASTARPAPAVAPIASPAASPSSPDTCRMGRPC